jgi:hypothetical protein
VEKDGFSFGVFMIQAQRILAPLLLAAVSGFLGCSPTIQVVSQWNNPAYTTPPLRRILVGGSGGESAIRRNLEDEFVAQLRTAGIDAVPSYRYIPNDPNVDESELKRVAKEAGADAVIFARSVGMEQKTEYHPGYYPYTSFGFFGPHFGASWYGLYGAPSIRNYNVYTSETTLYDVGKNEVVWTGTVRTYDPQNVNGAIQNYVETVLKALNEKQLLRTGGR